MKNLNDVSVLHILEMPADTLAERRAKYEASRSMQRRLLRDKKQALLVSESEHAAFQAGILSQLNEQLLAVPSGHNPNLSKWG